METQLNLIIKGLIVFMLIALIVSVIGYLSYKGYLSIRETNEQSVLAEQEIRKEEEADTVEQLEREKQENIVRGLSAIKKTGGKANLGDLEVELNEQRILDTLAPIDCSERQSDGKICLFDKEERYVIGLKFTVTNISDGDQTFNRMSSGAISTKDNVKQRIDISPFASGDYLKQLGETYTYANANLLLKPGETKTTWIVIEVDVYVDNGIFLYPPSEPNSKWEIEN